MKEHFSNEIDQVFMDWCIARGFTLDTPHAVLLRTMAEEHEQRIQAAEARGDRVIAKLTIDGSITFDTIEEAKDALDEFKRVFDLE